MNINQWRRTPGLIYRKGAIPLMSVCTLLVAISNIGILLTANLIITRAGNPVESNLVAVLVSFYPFFVYAGSLATVALLMFTLFGTFIEFRRKHLVTSLVLAATGTLIAIADYPVLKNAVLALPVTKSFMAGTRYGVLAILCTAVAAATWTLYLWIHSDRTFISARVKRAELRILRIFLNTGPGQIARFAPSFLLIAGIICALVILVETSFHTGWIVSNYNISDGLVSYWMVSLAAAMIIGIMYSFLLTSLLVIPMIVIRILKRFLSRNYIRVFKKYSSRWIPRITGMLLGLSIIFFVYRGVAAVFYDELFELQMVTLAGCALIMLGILIGNIVSGNLHLFCASRGKPKDFTDLVRIYLLCLILWPIGPIARYAGWKIQINRKMVIVACTILGSFMVYFVIQSFPSLYDITSRAISIWSVALVFSAMTMGYLIFPPHKRFWVAKLVLLVTLFAISTATMATIRTNSSVRLLFYEYSSISKANFQMLDDFLPRQKEWYKDAVPLRVPKPELQLPEDCPAFTSIREKRPLIVFVIMDACRPDRMGIYGHNRLPSTTRHMERFKDDFVLFDTAVSQATATTCSTRHFFTGKYSSRFMLKKKDVGEFFLNDLLRGGYHSLLLNITGSDYNGISSMAFMREMPLDLLERVKYSLDGITYDQYRRQMKLIGEEITEEHQHMEMEQVQKLLDRRLVGRTPPVIKDLELVSFTDQNDEQKVETFFSNIDARFKTSGDSWDASGTFAFIHMHSTHFPWKEYPHGHKYGEKQEDLYDHTVSYTDYCVGKLIDGLKQRGIFDNSIVIITADHGTGLNEHGRYGGFNPYYEQIHIPLMIHVPGIEGGRMVSSLVGLFDIGPTLTAPFNSERLHEMDGVPLWPLLLQSDEQSMDNRVIFSLNSFADSYSLICSDGAHFIWQRTDRYNLLFNFRNDPAECRLLMDHDKDTLNKCRSYMKWFISNAKRGYDNPYHYKEKEYWRGDTRPGE